MEHGGRARSRARAPTSCSRITSIRFDLDRRGFLKSLGGGILVFHLLNTAHAEQQPRGRRGGGGGGETPPAEIAAWLHIGEDGKISVYTGKAEVGQNIRTSLAQAVAEELHASPQSIRLVMADTQLTPFDRAPSEVVRRRICHIA